MVLGSSPAGDKINLKYHRKKIIEKKEENG